MQQPTPPPTLEPAPTPASALAIVNARVWTGDPRRPWADALLVRGERIEAVGSSAEVKKRAGATVKVLDAKGMMVTACSMEGNVGRLAPGMLADLVLLDADVARVLPETIRDARVMLTMISGRVVHDPAGLIR